MEKRLIFLAKKLLDRFFFSNPNKNWNVQIINRFHEFSRGSSKLIFRLISNFIMSYNVKVLGPKFTKIRLWIYTQTNHLFSLNAIKILLQNGADLASATVPWHWLFFLPYPKSLGKSLKAQKWHWLILAPLDALAHFVWWHSSTTVTSPPYYRLPIRMLKCVGRLKHYKITRKVEKIRI